MSRGQHIIVFINMVYLSFHFSLRLLLGLLVSWYVDMSRVMIIVFEFDILCDLNM